MPYVHVLRLIDTEIARLQQVRELLLPSLPTKLTKVLPSLSHLQTLQPAEIAVLAQQAGTAPADPVKAQAPVTIKYVPAKRERASKGRRGTRNKTALVVGNTAFQGPVPNGPVYVPADKLRALQQKHEAELRKEAPGDVFTAEQLSRLWLRSTAD